jgi:hypothetical protein
MTADKYHPQAILMWLETDQQLLLAGRSVQLWTAIADELVPIVGDRGFVALFNRCLDICGTTFPWLLKAPARSSPPRCFDMLGAQLSGCEPPEGLAASRALFSTFHDLLLMLIGEPLAGGVLEAAWRDLLRHPDGKPIYLPAQSAPEEQDEHKHR